MATATRSFIVFKDEPEVAPTPAVEKKENQTGPSATYVIAPPPGPLLVYAPDKENIDPFTGTRSSGDLASGKKRKTALTVKTQPTSPTKRMKPLSEKTAKKPTSKSRGADKKVKRTVSKRAASTRVHREPSLPRVAEENEVASQAVIDSKCKDLTVLPLADISEAHDVSVAKEDSVARGEPTAEKQTRGETPAIVSEAGTERSTTPEAEEATSAVTVSAASVFSTPERKRIYSAFTFTSPSPASKRYATTRGSSVDRFSDAAF
ncbi:hypothetical protein C8Q70DRAFT_1046471 [Cubamyces menziesii]|uniref:Uncharacterized protein n=1 Tax=Trametes cubensis TaxID=1111947 RepID=A0AAD7X410_9APHY|nr:hypothetical protein C8Q70DRAFT_1046471 [Cubamyces menziesii]KAJ8457408.1 hypothetical protein ONZ51_g11551 [Trametes cubensis]